MAKLLNVEKSRYINDNISIYTQNKVGQYSKFLDKNPIFVTYYHINRQMSRSDVGTGGIDAELGPQSPIRFNKITQFPIYNLPDSISPDVNFDESGFDIDIDLSDITILPGTIRPIPGDYIILDYPGIKQFLFRVNNFRYNTIQSNDFYLIDLDLKYAELGNLEDKYMKGQIVEEYLTIFDNIGTNDRCFIRSTDVDKLNTIVGVIKTLKDIHISSYFNKEMNAFVLVENPCPRCNDDGVWLYDLNMEKFITESRIYYEDEKLGVLTLTPADTPQLKFSFNFTKTFWNAVLKRSMRYINDHTYFYQTAITKQFSPFVLYDYPCNSVQLYLTKCDLINRLINWYPDPNDKGPNDGAGDKWCPGPSIKDPAPGPDEMAGGSGYIESLHGSIYDYANDRKEHGIEDGPSLPLVLDESHVNNNEETVPPTEINPPNNKDEFPDDGSGDVDMNDEDNGNETPPKDPEDGSGDVNIDDEEENKPPVDPDAGDAGTDNGEHLPEPEEPSVEPEEPKPKNAPYHKWLFVPTDNTSEVSQCHEVCPLREYFPFALINDIKTSKLTSDDYLDEIIFNYFLQLKMDVDVDKLLEVIEPLSLRNFMYLPIIIYILSRYYDEYFNRPNDL